ncbi:uncharacterized protein LOC121406549 [Lytechinus variegatus]|uniref:uncharacterized protein LOC121406549 n=1 Tax=Lytechinus variegatus TaxID=7654 RepID=UPI001BB2651C|nr:uncharacterized protein LOC121406549 [Lytechinus variegatus]
MADKKGIIAMNDDETGREPQSKENQDTSEDVQDEKGVVTQQPKSDNAGPSDDKDDKEGVKKEGPSVGIEIDPTNMESCVSASAGVGFISKDYGDGTVNAKYVGPNVGCVLNCSEFPTVITDCTFEICSANYLLGKILCKVGLTFDTKLIWTAQGVQAELFSTGLDTSEGIALGALGFKIGLADKEKREKKWAKMKLKWGKKKVAPLPSNEEVNAGEENAEEGNGESN